MVGLVAGVNSPEFTLAKAVMFNTFYETSAWCTSIIARQADGSIIHARNLDYGVPGMEIYNSTFRARFVQDGRY